VSKECLIPCKLHGMAKPLKLPKCPKHADVTLVCPACLGEEHGAKGAEITNQRMTKHERTARAIKTAKARWKTQSN
jgi:hypothetical protein